MKAQEAISRSQPESDHAASTAERVEILRAVSLFADLAAQPDALGHFAEILKVRRFGAGQAMISEGEAGTELFILVEGQASVYKTTAEGDRYKVAILHGESRAFFGEGGLLDSDARSATIVADGTCHCLVLGREEFGAFCRAHPELALPVLSRIARVVMARLRKTNNDLTLLYRALIAEIRGS